MTTKLPLSLPLRTSSFRLSGSGAPSGEESPQGGKRGSSGAPGLWTGTRDGIVASVLAFGGAIVFGGGAGTWFAAGASGWMGQALVISAGSMLMAAMVSLFGSLLAGRNPVFWGIGMPLLIYVCGTVFALLSGHAGAAMLFYGAPVFMGLAITAGVMVAFAVDRD